MKKFTLDTNCLIAVDENRYFSDAIKVLLEANERKFCCIALVAASGSERQKVGEYDREYLETFRDFDTRRHKLGFGGVDLIYPIAYPEISFVNRCVIANDAMVAREKEIFETLFPNSLYEWRDYASAKGFDPKDLSTKGRTKWLNEFLDAQIFWTHDHNKRDVFVTSDANFAKRLKPSKFPSAKICDPEEAVVFLSKTN